MGANTFFFQLLPAMSATIFITDIPVYFLRKHPDKECEEQIADINMRHQNKEEIAENTTGHQPQQIKDRGCGSQLPEQIIEHCQSDNQKQPDAQQKD